MVHSVREAAAGGGGYGKEGAILRAVWVSGRINEDR